MSIKYQVTKLILVNAALKNAINVSWNGLNKVWKIKSFLKKYLLNAQEALVHRNMNSNK